MVNASGKSPENSVSLYKSGNMPDKKNKNTELYKHPKSI
jgi:hypothetical protein